MRASPPWRTLPERLLLAGCLLLGACTTVGPDFVRPEVPWLNDWSSSALRSDAAEGQPRDRAATEQWWRNFNDPALDRLVAEAQRAEHRRAHCRPAHSRGTRPARHRRQHTLSATAATDVVRRCVPASSSRTAPIPPFGATASASTSHGNWTSGASSGAASSLRMLPISPASPVTTTCRCWSRRRPPASTPPSAPSNSACALRTRTPRCRNAALKSPNACSRAATSPSSMSSRPGRST